MKTIQITRIRALAIIAALAVSAAIGIPQAQTANRGGGAEYTLVLIAPADVPLASGAPQDVNDDGNVAGWYETIDGEQYAYYYDFVKNTFTTLEDGTTARSLNNAGEIVGEKVLAPAVIDAVYWSSAQAGATTLQGLPANTVSRAYSINKEGVISGSSLVDDTLYAVLWVVGDVQLAAVLPPLAGTTHAEALHVSDFDEAGIAHVVGYSSLTRHWQGDVDGRATLWDVWFDNDGTLHVSGAVDLGVLANGPSQAWSVNAAGDVCARSDRWPVVKLDGQPMTALPASSKTIEGYAMDINAGTSIAGYVVEYTRFTGSHCRAWLWSAGKGSDLNGKVRLDRSEVLEIALAISKKGHIVGTGVFAQPNAGYVLLPN